MELKSISEKFGPDILEMLQTHNQIPLVKNGVNDYTLLKIHNRPLRISSFTPHFLAELDNLKPVNGIEQPALVAQSLYNLGKNMALLAGNEALFVDHPLGQTNFLQYIPFPFDSEVAAFMAEADFASIYMHQPMYPLAGLARGDDFLEFPRRLLGATGFITYR